jgi:hypothetical protein
MGTPIATVLRTFGVVLTSMTFAQACASPALSDCGAPPSPHFAGGGGPSSEIISLAGWLAAGRLRTVNRQVAAINGDTGVRVTAAEGDGLIWIKDTDFGEGTVEADVCGRDVDSQSFVGVAFHRRDDKTFEAVYLRPFNFRASSAERRNHAVQYIAEPDYDYSRLRQKFPNEFEHSVDPVIVPTAWVPMRVDVRDSRVRVFVGAGVLALDVRELRAAAGGQIGLYVGNGSDGVFANVRIVHSP